jgi:L-fucose isomerase-like protein
MELSPKELVEKMEANHLHAVAGDWRNELQRLCKILDIEAVVL